jgi:hypothetical protein
VSIAHTGCAAINEGKTRNRREGFSQSALIPCKRFRNQIYFGLLDSTYYIRATEFIELVTRQNIILERQGDRRGFCLLICVGLSAGLGWQGSRYVGLSGAAALGQSSWAGLAGQQATQAPGAWQ